MTDIAGIIKASLCHTEAFRLHLLECFFLKFLSFEGHFDRGNAKCSPNPLLPELTATSPASLAARWDHVMKF